MWKLVLSKCADDIVIMSETEERLRHYFCSIKIRIKITNIIRRRITIIIKIIVIVIITTTTTTIIRIIKTISIGDNIWQNNVN